MRCGRRQPHLGFPAVAGMIWPLIRLDRCAGMLDNRALCPGGSKSFCSGFGVFCSSR